MAIKGLFLSNAGIVGDRVQDFASAMLYLHAGGTAPLLAISSGMESEDGGDVIFSWFEEVKITNRAACVSGGTGTSVVVSDASAFVPGAVLLVEETGEFLLVTAVASNTLTVTRGIGGSTVVSITGAHNVVKVGTAHEEASNMPQAVMNQGQPFSNYQQIFRNTWSVSGTAKAITFQTGDKVAKSKREAAGFHSEDMERAYIWGTKHVGSLNGKPFYMMDGLLTQIAARGGKVRTQPGGGMTLAEFRDFLRDIFTTNVKGMPNERICFGGNIALQVLNEAARKDGVHNFDTGATEFGLKFSKFISPFGELTIMTHPIMNESPVWQKELYVLHPGGIKTKWLRRTFHDDYDRSGTRANGIDADQGVITSQTSIKAMAAATMGIYKGITTAVASA